jgi:hypothetical protein
MPGVLYREGVIDVGEEVGVWKEKGTRTTISQLVSDTGRVTKR